MRKKWSSMSNRQEDDYQFSEQLGKGVYGIVYNATNISTGNVVAIKVPRRERDSAVAKEKKTLEVQSLIFITTTRDSKVSLMS
jgi:serine/threonine protein kinase